MGIPHDRERLARALPYAVVAVAGQVSATIPPGPTDFFAFWLSCTLLVVSAVLVVTLPARQPSNWLVGGGIYIASVASLMLATGGVTSGLGSLLLIPVVAVALYGRRWESVIIGVAVIIALWGVSFAGQHLAAETVRRVVLFGSIATMLSVSIHALRGRLVVSNERTTRLLRQAEAINAAARRLATLLDPPSIAAVGTELATLIASPPGSEFPRALYFRIQDHKAIIDAVFDESGDTVEETVWSIAEHPPLGRAVESAQPVLARFDEFEFGPRTQAALAKTGVTHGAWVPVCPGGTLHGVLSIASRGVPISEDCLERCIALGHLLELALSNWAAHQRLEQQATAEERRRIARELHDGLAHELAFIASKTRKPSVRTAGGVDVRELACAADRALDEARRAITVLSASSPQPLPQAVAQTAEDLAARLGVAVRLDLADDIEMPGEVTENLLRILREAMTNAANHGQPRFVTVKLDNTRGVRLTVEDDGRGFDPGNGSRSSGFGLLSMEERAISVGAHFSVDSSPSHGTRVEVAFE